MEGHLGKLWASRKGIRHPRASVAVLGEAVGKLGEDGRHRKLKEAKQARKQSKPCHIMEEIMQTLYIVV